MPDSKLNADLVLRQAFDESTGKISVDAAVTIEDVTFPAGLATEDKQDTTNTYLQSIESSASGLATALIDTVSVGNAAAVANVQMIGGLDGSTARFIKTNSNGELQTVAVQQYKTIVDEASASVTYVGRAVPGTLTSAASWQISKFTLTGNVLEEQTADGNLNFDNIWDNRASLSYS